MARKSKGNAIASDAPYNGGTKHWSISGDEAENGFVVNASHEGKDGYKSKKFIAPNEGAAIRLAIGHISSCSTSKSKGKKGKKGKSKIAVGKRA